jgi:mannose-6-phosphate isomerase-like protein (cupin superfamily)
VKIRVRDHARFREDRPARVALTATARVQLDLYCLEPGQAQAIHTHADQDKVYLVLEGRARVTVGDREEWVESGEVVVAPAGTSHGLANPGPERLLALGIVSPPPHTP